MTEEIMVNRAFMLGIRIAELVHGPSLCPRTWEMLKKLAAGEEALVESLADREASLMRRAGGDLESARSALETLGVTQETISAQRVLDQELARKIINGFGDDAEHCRFVIEKMCQAPLCDLCKSMLNQ